MDLRILRWNIRYKFLFFFEWCRKGMYCVITFKNVLCGHWAIQNLDRARQMERTRKTMLISWFAFTCFVCWSHVFITHLDELAILHGLTSYDQMTEKQTFLGGDGERRIVWWIPLDKNKTRNHRLGITLSKSLCLIGNLHLTVFEYLYLKSNI